MSRSERQSEYYDILPFRFLDAAGRAEASRHLIEQAVAAGQFLVMAGDAEDKRVFLLLDGEVEIVDPETNAVAGHIESGHYFGERAALFDQPRVRHVRASGVVRVAVLPGRSCCRCCGRSRPSPSDSGRCCATNRACSSPSSGSWPS